ncbi:hypothetical protein Tco_1389777, partial [Tanacetum coccineum]
MYILVNGAVAAKSGSCCLRDVAASFDSAVHRVHAVSFDAAVASIVSAACFVPADSLSSIPADNVPAGHVLVPADKVDIEEDENEPELTYPYEEVDPLNPPPPAFDSEPKDVIEVEDTVEPEDETVLASVHKILDLGNKVRSSMEEGTAAMENLVKKLGNVKEKAECKKLKKELEEARGFVFEERSNEAIDVPVEDEKSPSSEPLGSPPVVRRMIKESVDAAIAAEQARHANVGNDARGSVLVSGQDVAPVVRECTFVGFMKCNPTVFCEGKKVKFAAAILQGPALTWWNSKVATIEFCPIEEIQRMEHELWNMRVKEYNIVAYTQRFNELALMCLRMVKPESVKVDAYIRGLSENIKGENNQKQGNARAMTTALTRGKVSYGLLPVCECCFSRHVGPCMIKCHKCGKVRHKSRYYKKKSIAKGAKAQPV